jgi:chitodextrinase
MFSLLALAIAPAPATASSAMYFTLQTDGQISFVSGPCSSNGSLLSCSPGNVIFHDGYGMCTIYISKSNDPFTGGTWSITNFAGSCPYQTTGAASATVLHRTSQPAPTPTPFVPAPTPTPAPPVLTATVEAPLLYVSGPCTANPVTGGQLSAPPTYRCTATGTISVKVSQKAACTFAIVRPATTGGAWGVTKTGVCTFALKGGNQLDLRPH